MFGTAVHTRQASPNILDREVDSIAAAMADGDCPVGRAELAGRVRCGLWGPGRFRNALREAESAGRVRRVSRSMYEPAAD